MLAVIFSPRGLKTTFIGEATLSQELHTAGLLQQHVLVEYQWQNTGLYFHTNTTNTYATSCRNPHRPVREQLTHTVPQ